MYWSNRNFNIRLPGHTPLPSRRGRKLIFRVFRWVENLPPCIKGGEFEPYLDFMLHVSLLWRIGYEAKAYTSFVLCWKYFLFVCFFLYESCFEYMNISCVYNRIQYQRLIKLIIIIIIITITIIVIIIITVLIMMILLTV